MDDYQIIGGTTAVAVAALIAERDSLRSEVADLREALEVFGEIGARIHPTKDSSLILAYLPSWDIEDKTSRAITSGDLRRAAAVLAKHKG